VYVRASILVHFAEFLCDCCLCTCLRVSVPQIVVRLNKGLGISLVDRTPEELVYIMFRDVGIEYVQENEEQTMRADVCSLQVSALLVQGDHRICSF